jgi:hypothetical protein
MALLNILKLFPPVFKGNGASAAHLESKNATGKRLTQSFKLYGKIESRADAAFTQVDADQSGTIEKPEFEAAARYGETLEY